MNQKEESFMVCAQVEAVADPLPGTTKTQCCTCNKPVLISRASRRVSAMNNLKPICVSCFGESRVSQILTGNVAQMLMTAEQCAEIIGAVHRN